ncbi:MAG TPA: GYF domain-containing protein [Blastocatellia bacterium]|nr:GYF domain-containing protein [Blastocatellia bacterium]
MLCQICGHVLGVTAKFCPSCGATVDDNPRLPATLSGGDYSPNAPFHPPAVISPPSLPGSTSISATGTDTYFLVLNGQKSGPYTVNQMRVMWQSGTINAGTHYWQDGMTGWQALANIRHFLDTPAAAQPTNQIVVNQVNQAQPILFHSAKSRGTFIVLGLFLGCLGVHNFYAGYSGKGVAQLLITVCVGWVFGLGFFITGIWALIEIIAVNTDAQGLRMS